MLNIQASQSTAAHAGITPKQVAGAAKSAQFDALLAMANASPALASSARASVAASGEASPFALTSEFQAVFGSTGPLIDFINRVTTGLGLSAEKNLALQNIAIANKDTDRSPASVARIREQLRAAGIQG